LIVDAYLAGADEALGLVSALGQAFFGHQDVETFFRHIERRVL
jgi:hypothetical protein